MLLRNPRTGETVETHGEAARRFMAYGWTEVETARRKRGPGRPKKDGSWPTPRRTTSPRESSDR